jgi:hypothetical protein
MHNAFNKVLLMVMIKLIIGSDLIALESDDIIAAIENLDNNDIVMVLQKMVAITFRNKKFKQLI